MKLSFVVSVHYGHVFPYPNPIPRIDERVDDPSWVIYQWVRGRRRIGLRPEEGLRKAYSFLEYKICDYPNYSHLFLSLMVEEPNDFALQRIPVVKIPGKPLVGEVLLAYYRQKDNLFVSTLSGGEYQNGRSKCTLIPPNSPVLLGGVYVWHCPESIFNFIEQWWNKE